MLQNSPATGVFFLLAVMSENPTLFFMMGLATVFANATAYVLRLNPTHLHQGLYGFSPALVGLFVAVFFAVNWASVVLLLIGAAVAMGLQAVGLYYRLPLYTLPFIVASWGIYLLGAWLNLPTNHLSTLLIDISFDNPFINGVLKSTGQVMFLGSIPAAVLCLIGFVANDFRQNQGKYAAFVLMAGAVAFGVAFVFGAERQMLAMGLWGYNSVLTVIALADKKPWVWLLGIVVTLFIQWLFTILFDFAFLGGFLTLPFVLAVWVVMAVVYLKNKWLLKNSSNANN